MKSVGMGAGVRWGLLVGTWIRLSFVLTMYMICPGGLSKRSMVRIGALYMQKRR